jgi:hypothetical protein
VRAFGVLFVRGVRFMLLGLLLVLYNFMLGHGLLPLLFL